MKNKWVYLFSEGNADMRDLLGGKGAGVAEMTRAGVPVPPGFTITTEACNAYFDQGQFPEGLWEQVLVGVQKIEAQTGKTFGNTPIPMLVSVRSGAKFSMPGMMDPVLNLGLNRTTLEGLAGQYGDGNSKRRFAQDAHRRFIQLYGKIVLGINPNRFDHELERIKKGRSDADLSAVELEQLAECFRLIVQQEKQFPFPEDPFEQLKQAITAVFDSWNGRRARDYRRLNKIPDNLGTAVTVQAIVFGNLDKHSATGVSFTRNPNTGEAELFGEYLVNAQGEDVVAGIRSPKPLSTLKEEMPALFEELNDIMDQLEAHYFDMQDVEFTIAQCKLWMRQTRTGKRTGTAAVKIAVDLVHEGLIDRATATKRITPAQLEQMLYPTLDPATLNNIWPLATGLPASPGAASGTVVFDPD